MMDQQQPLQPTEEHPVSIIPASAANPVTVQIVPRRLTMYQVTAEDIDRLRSSSTTAEDTLLGIAAGGAIASLTALTTVSLDDRGFFGFLSGFLVSAGFTV